MPSENSSSDTSPSASEANTGDSNVNNSSNSPILQNKIELLLAATRAVTIICTFLYIVPIFGRSVQMSAYQKALLANGATSALRLHQRIPNFRLNMEFFNMLFLEDSAHYLFYSILFIFSRQITMVLLPIFLFALLHLLSFVLRALSESDRQAELYHRTLRFVEMYKIYIFKLIALSEIILAPLVLLSSIGDFSKLFLMFPYYRFLVFRYISRRNPYNRTMFTELKNTTIQVVSQPQCPQMVRTIAYKGISLVSSLAPAHDHAN